MKGSVKEIELRVGALVQTLGQPGVWKIERFIARGVVLVPVDQPAIATFRQSCEGDHERNT